MIALCRYILAEVGECALITLALGGIIVALGLVMGTI